MNVIKSLTWMSEKVCHMRTLLYIVLFLVFIPKIHAQFSLDAEIRPRAEIRSGFRQLRDSTSKTAGLISQRSRINLGFKNDIMNTRISFQDIRVWGDERLKQDIPSTALHEAWIDLKVMDSLSVKVGRQELTYDNQRLFGPVNWLQQAVAHDAAVAKFHYNNWIVDVGFAYNQTSDTILSDTYYSMTKNNYKTLEYLWATKKFEKLSISGVFIADGYQKIKDTVNTRLTYGGILNYDISNIYIAARSFLQSGKTVGGQTIQALYVNGDISFKLGDFKPLIGIEYFSGNNNSDKTDLKYHAFNPLYGTSHIFNGSMEYFTKPENTKNAGLTDIYVNCNYKLSDKTSLRVDYHYFALSNKYINPVSDESIHKYLASEVDLSLKASVNKDVAIDIGYSVLKGEKSLTVIQGRGDNKKINQWVFLMLTAKPKFL